MQISIAEFSAASVNESLKTKSTLVQSFVAVSSSIASDRENFKKSAIVKKRESTFFPNCCVIPSTKSVFFERKYWLCTGYNRWADTNRGENGGSNISKERRR